MEDTVRFDFNLSGIKSQAKREEIKAELQRLKKLAESMEVERKEDKP